MLSNVQFKLQIGENAITHYSIGSEERGLVAMVTLSVESTGFISLTLFWSLHGKRRIER